MPNTEADQLFEQGKEFFLANQFSAAIQSLQQALKLYHASQHLSQEAQVTKMIGNAYLCLGDYIRATTFYQKSLITAQAIKDFDLESRVLNNLGLTHKELGKPKEAIDFYKQSLKLAQQLGDRQGEAEILGNIGSAYHFLGNYYEAIQYQQKSLKLAQELQERRTEASALGNMGLAYHELSDYAVAIDCYQRSLKILQEVRDERSAGQTLQNLATAYINLGDYTKANDYLKQQMEIASAIGDLTQVGGIHSNLGIICYELQDYYKAIENHKQHLAIALDMSNLPGQGIALNGLGNNYLALGDYSKALECRQQSRAIKQQISDRLGEGEALLGLGDIYLAQSQYSQAIAYYQQSLAIFQEIDEQDGQGTALSHLGTALFFSGNLAEAERILRKGIQTWQFIRKKLGSNDTFKVSIFELHASTYKLLQAVLICLGKEEEALEVSEQGRARAFVELLARRLWTSPKEIFDIEPPTIGAIKQIAQTQKATFVEYSIIPKQFNSDKSQTLESELFIWVIKPSGEIIFRSVELKSLWQQQNNSLSNLVIQAREFLGVEEKLRDTSSTTSLEITQPIKYISQPLRQLHQYLIEPIANLLPNDTNAPVIFIPQGELFLVPFPALQDATGKFLIEEHTILTAPSIQTLELTSQQQQSVGTINESPLQSQDVLVVGNPTMPTIPLQEPLKPLEPLPGSEAEAVAIASLFNTQPIIGDRATKVYIEKLMPQARFIHLATHGLLDDIKQLGVPGAIALAPSEEDNGFLTAGEILEMKLNAELVVLSACSSGQGKITGDGVIGLSRSLFATGVPSIIVSLWSVGDKSTQFLMTEFYHNLQQGMNKAKALRQAILTIMKKKRFSRPKSWAGFTLIGEAE